MDDLIGEGQQDGFDFVSVGADDVLSAAGRSKSQAVGVDHLLQSFVYSALPAIATYIRDLFSKSLSTSTFPQRWKQTFALSCCSAFCPTYLRG